jgi:hypothetical protein
MKFGKLAPKYNKKTLRLGKYLLDSPPSKTWREYKVKESDWQMFSNDTIGDCTCAAIAHMLMLFTAHTGKMVIPDVSDVIKAYSAVSGYDPATGANDNGAAISDVLEYWQTTGIAGHKIAGWAAIDPTNALRLQQGIYLFGAVDAGFNVPASAMTQFSAGEAWDIVADDGGIEGGHSVPLFGYGSAGFDCCTWAKNQKLTNAFEKQYFDEAYCVITQDWLDSATGLAPNTLNMDALVADLKEIEA